MISISPIDFLSIFMGRKQSFTCCVKVSDGAVNREYLANNHWLLEVLNYPISFFVDPIY
tara:strand:- start:626 stop:802 length:177 start_codon:yes stop_codon:yes gene_type:complete